MIRKIILSLLFFVMSFFSNYSLCNDILESEDSCWWEHMISPELAHKNKEKFDAFRALALPLGQYFITGGGPLGIRDLRVINDIDIVVSNELWNSLSAQYGVVVTNGITKIVFSNINVEAFREGSFGAAEEISDNRRVKDRMVASKF